MIAIPLTYHADSLQLLERISKLDWPVMLDSSKGFSGHQIDILAANPLKRIHFDGNIFTITCETPAQNLKTNNFTEVREFIDLTLKSYQTVPTSKYGPGWLGAVAYDFLQLAEQTNIKGTKNPEKDAFMLGFYPWIVVVDHSLEKTVLLGLKGQETQLHTLEKLLSGQTRASNPDTNGNRSKAFHLTNSFKPDTSSEEYNQAFQEVQRYILAGDCYQINLTQRFSATYEGQPAQAYIALRRQHGAPMACYFDYGSGVLCSLSPERFLKVEDRAISTQPIKGTIGRGSDEESDNNLKQQLFLSGKDRAENVMIVDLLRNDLGKISKTGSVRTSKLFDIETFPNVHHMVSTIAAELRDDITCFDAFLACFPGGSITGAPKIRAMEIIEELESHARDLYCGAFIYMPVTGYFDSNILIRSLVLKEGSIWCWGGGGVVADSLQDLEYQESITKISQLMSILDRTFETD